MKQFFSLLFCFFTSFVLAQIPPEAQNWGKVFEDNFDNTTLDASKWKLGLHWLGSSGIAGNSGRNISVGDGNLKILGKHTPIIFGGKTYQYSAGEISTFQNFRIKYGYLEARIKYDAIKGLWPAFWLMPDRGNYGNPNLNQESYIKFDLSNISQPITTAILKIKIVEMEDSGTKNVSIHKLLNLAWSENDIKWGNRPAFDPVWIQQLTGSGDASLTSDLVKGEFISVDVSDYINAQIATNSNAGFALIDQFMRASVVEFATKEAINEADRPYLDIDGAILLPSDDTYVKAGTSTNTNFGSKKYMRVSEPWEQTSSTYNGAMEFDIMESLGVWGADRTQHAMHWDGYGADHQKVESEKQTLEPTSDGYHVYGMLWKQGEVEFYVDGNKTWTYTNSRVGSIPVYIILSLQMGGWAGNQNPNNSQLPGEMLIDYVRVYDPDIVATPSFEANKYQLVISPNPVQDVLGLTVRTKSNQKNVNYFIADVKGRKLFQSNLELNSQGSSKINIPIGFLNLKNGIYFLTVGGSTISFKK